jgi:2-keto-3-deoxy-L-rhamnonate aldolase RhmA
METIANLASWFQATNVSAIVRIRKSFAHLIPGILDQGIMGIQVSEVENAKEARAIVRLAKSTGRRIELGYLTLGNGIRSHCCPVN